MSDSPPEPGYPFDLPSADLTLRSADGVDFHVHGAVLSIASPFFRDMLSLPLPHNDGSDCDRSPPPVIPVPEDSKNLKALLQLCYPINKQSLMELEEIAPVLKAALKYEMDWPVTLLTRDLLAIMPRRPLKTWAIACYTGLEDVASQAALEMLRSYSLAQDGENVHGAVSVIQEIIVKEGVGSLDGVSARDYFVLHEFLLANDQKKALRDFSPQPAVSTFGPSVAESDHRITTFLPRFELPDLVLRCPSGTSHPAHQLILSFHSPVIAALISTAKSTSIRSLDSNVDDPQYPLRIDIDLHSDTVVTLLNTCYDNAPCIRSTLAELGPIILAVEKYQMPLIRKAAKERWDELACSTPLDAYFTAVRYGLAPQAKAAARAALACPISGTYIHSMEWASALSYHHLVEYYGSCAAAVRRAARAVSAKWKLDYKIVERQPISPRELFLGGTMATYIYDTVNERRHDCPGRYFKEFTLAALLERSRSEKGSLWPERTAEACHTLLAGLSELSRRLPGASIDAISQVKLRLD